MHGIGLAASRRMLDQVTLARATRPSVGDQSSNAVELLVSGEDEEAFACLPSPLVLLPGPRG